MDTTKIEYTAEDLIAHKLQRSDILVAKPKFDRRGTDLLALLSVGNGAKFCRIQCKGRSLKQRTAHIDVPQDYVRSEGYILFLFIETGERDHTHLYCFFRRDICKWPLISKNHSYRLSFSKTTFKTELETFAFDDSKVHQIKKAIIDVDIQDVFLGYMEAVEDDDTMDSSIEPRTPL